MSKLALRATTADAGVTVTKGVTDSTTEQVRHLALAGRRTACGLSFDDTDDGATAYDEFVTCAACRTDWMHLTPEHPWTPFSVADKAGVRAAARKIHDVAVAQVEASDELSLKDAYAFLKLMNPVDRTGRSLFDKSAASIPGLTTDSARALRKSVAEQRTAAARRQDVLIDTLDSREGNQLNVGDALSLLQQMNETDYPLNVSPHQYRILEQLPPAETDDAGD